MKVLVVGSGAREHVLVWKLSQSARVKKIYASPGNAGISQLAECAAIDSSDISGLVYFALKQKIDLTIVGPEIPLVNGLVDEFQKKGLNIFGPDKRAARLEGSKVFAKEVMRRYNIPTPDFKVFSQAAAAKKYLEGKRFPLVIKADGLAAGKGVIMAKTKEEAAQAIKQIMEDKIFGPSGDKLIVEDCLFGEEVSILAISDGEGFITLLSSQDHKRAYDGDKGPNTGGMGAYCPTQLVNKELSAEIAEKIIRPTIQGLGKEGIPYKGVLYAGLMLTAAGPQVLEFNARFGDPETQAILPLLRTDLVDISEKVIIGKISDLRLSWEESWCVCVVLASGGYPGECKTGYEIKGLEYFHNQENIWAFHSGTKISGNKLLTSGGRVLSVVARGQTLPQALDSAYAAAGHVEFQDMHYRKDIAWRALEDSKC